MAPLGQKGLPPWVEIVGQATAALLPVQSIWRHQVSTVGRQALERVEGAEESQGRKAFGIDIP